MESPPSHSKQTPRTLSSDHNKPLKDRPVECGSSIPGVRQTPLLVDRWRIGSKHRAAAEPGVGPRHFRLFFAANSDFLSCTPAFANTPE
jgi:hypothetical protein